MPSGTRSTARWRPGSPTSRMALCIPTRIWSSRGRVFGSAGCGGREIEGRHRYGPGPSHRPRIRLAPSPPPRSVDPRLQQTRMPSATSRRLQLEQFPCGNSEMRWKNRGQIALTAAAVCAVSTCRIRRSLSMSHRASGSEDGVDRLDPLEAGASGAAQPPQ